MRNNGSVVQHRGQKKSLAERQAAFLESPPTEDGFPQPHRVALFVTVFFLARAHNENRVDDLHTSNLKTRTRAHTKGKARLERI